MTQWCDDDFCARVRARCAELNRSAGQVLRKAGIAHDFVSKPPVRGRRIDTMERLAHELDWSLAEIMGFSDVPGRPAFRADQELMRCAVEVKRDVMLIGRIPRDVQTEAHILTTIYNVLAKQRAKGVWPIPQELLDMMGSTLIEQRGNAAQLISTPDQDGAEENNNELISS